MRCSLMPEDVVELLVNPGQLLEKGWELKTFTHQEIPL